MRLVVVSGRKRGENPGNGNRQRADGCADAWADECADKQQSVGRTPCQAVQTSVRTLRNARSENESGWKISEEKQENSPENHRVRGNQKGVARVRGARKTRCSPSVSLRVASRCRPYP